MSEGIVQKGESIDMQKIMEMLAALLVAVGMGTGVVATFSPPQSSHRSAQSTVISVPPIKETQTPESRETQETGEGKNIHVAQAIAEEYGVSVADVTALRDKGLGFGDIAKVYALAKATGNSVNDIVNMTTSGQGWGEIEKTLNVKPGSVEPNL